MEDKEVIEKVLGGDNNAFGLLVEKYQTRVYNLALRMCGSEDDAFDLAQESFVRAWKNLESFQFESAFSTWLYRLSSNICLDYLRARKRRAAVSLTMTDEDDGESQMNLPDPGPGPEQAVLAAEDKRLLMEALNSLPADQRRIITLRAINDLSYAEIAGILNLQEGTVKSRLSRARTMLRNKLLQSGNNPNIKTSRKKKGGMRDDL